jgi:hypothetical protein
MIDIISNIVKKYIDNEAKTVKEGETKWLKVG